MAARWERSAFPWIATWEENRSRQSLPWSGRELARGIEFSSYALPTNRRDNVARGTLFDTPCFEWLDAYEQKSTLFTLAIRPMKGRETVAISDVLSQDVKQLGAGS